MPYCPTCGAETAAGETRCPDCGSLLASPPARRTTSARGSDLVVGFVAGLLALVVGFAATVALSDARENRELVAELLGSNGPAGAALSELLPEWYRVSSWAFLENHHVDVSASVDETFGGAEWVGEYTDTLLPTASQLQFLLPLLLVGAGVLVALRRRRNGPTEAALTGATVVAGYLPGIAAVAYVATFEVAVFGDLVLLEIGPDVGQAVLLAGLAYPLFFGGLGGLLGFVVERSLPVWDR